MLRKNGPRSVADMCFGAFWVLPQVRLSWSCTVVVQQAVPERTSTSTRAHLVLIDLLRTFWMLLQRVQMSAFTDDYYKSSIRLVR